MKRVRLCLLYQHLWLGVQLTISLASVTVCITWLYFSIYMLVTSRMRAPGVVKTTGRRLLASVDQTQASYLGEECILVNRKDEAVGRATKEQCHRWDNVTTGKMLHRAFSVLLFDSERRLLLQKRASSKITFPDYWTNTCCSHPLYVPEEMGPTSAEGVLRAAQRKLTHELGIPKHELPLSQFTYLTRIIYKAQSDSADWGEHELDYILIFPLRPGQNLTLALNPNEVSEVEFVATKRMKQILDQSTEAPSKVKVSPWFRLIAERFLFDWWKTLDSLDSLKQHSVIHDLEQ